MSVDYMIGCKKCKKFCHHDINFRGETFTHPQQIYDFMYKHNFSCGGSFVTFPDSNLQDAFPSYVYYDNEGNFYTEDSGD